MSFRVLDQARTFYGLSGQLLPGGYVTFYEAGTTTEKDVYGERALSTNNGDTIALDASGRLEHDVWASGDVRYRVYDSDDVEQADVDWNIDTSAAGLAWPDGDAGDVVKLDGAGGAVAEAILELPDPAGNTNKFLKCDGTTWLAATGPADANAVSGTNIVTINDDRALQWDDDSAPASGTFSTSEAVVFDTPFTSTPFVVAIPTSNSHSSGPVVAEITARSTTGFTVRFDVAEGDQADTSMVNAVPFTWFAIGNV